MTAQGIAAALDILSDLGVVGLMAFVLWGFLTERIVPKGRIEELRKELEEAKHKHEETLERMVAELQRLGDKIK